MISTAILLIDSALFLLIWLVQIIIYPSFKYIKGTELIAWHNAYTKRITVFVLPLMFSQVAFYGYALFTDANALAILSSSLVAIAWAVTFFKEVPLHNNIGNAINSDQSIIDLIRWNWPRTIAWSMVFSINFYRFITL